MRSIQHQNIKPGMVLKLKKEAIERYGENVTSPTYLVTGLKYREGYKVPYVRCGDLFFRPSDFAKVVSYQILNEEVNNASIQ